MDSATEFYEWSFEIRGNECHVVTNKPLGVHEENNAIAVIWSKEQLDFPKEVRVDSHTTAEGDAPAVRNKDVEGWNKYSVTFVPVGTTAV